MVVPKPPTLLPRVSFFVGFQFPKAGVSSPVSSTSRGLTGKPILRCLGGVTSPLSKHLQQRPQANGPPVATPYPPEIILNQEQQMVSWCSWLSCQSNTLKVSSPNLDDAMLIFYSHEVLLPTCPRKASTSFLHILKLVSSGTKAMRLILTSSCNERMFPSASIIAMVEKAATIWDWTPLREGTIGFGFDGVSASNAKLEANVGVTFPHFTPWVGIHNSLP
ncbi:hypothetical protein V6N13_123101 [Hibiscus sabdariffa]